jgi:hypothetical protein
MHVNNPPDKGPLTHTAQGLASLGVQVLNLKNLLLNSRDRIDVSLGDQGGAQVNPSDCGNEPRIEIRLNNGGRVRIALDNTTGATGDLKYLPREAYDMDKAEVSWNRCQISVSFGLHPETVQAMGHSSPETTPISICDKHSDEDLYEELGDATNSLLINQGQDFSYHIKWQLNTNKELSKALANLVQEVLPAITALNTALRYRLNA